MDKSHQKRWLSQWKIIFAFLAICSILVIALVLCLPAIRIALNSRSGQNEAVGIVTRKFIDCSGGEEMNALGAINSIEQVSCDGGSTITIDFTQTFRTSSGEGGPPFSVDTTRIAVGDKVRVRYSQDSEGNTTLNCRDCSIQKVP